MRTYFKILFCLFILVSSGQAFARICIESSDSIFDRIPVELSKNLRSRNLFRNDLIDLKNSGVFVQAEDVALQSSHFHEFLDLLQMQDQPERVISKLIHSQELAGLDIKERNRLYALEAESLRYFLNLGCFPNEYSKQVYLVWMKNYLEGINGLIQTAKRSNRSNSNALNRVAQMYTQFLQEVVFDEASMGPNNTLFKDFSPQRRAEISSEAEKHSGKMLDMMDYFDYRVFRVNGVHSASLKTMMVDLARPMTDTLVTIIHEVVHAISPEMREIDQKMPEQYKKAVSILTEKLLPSEQIKHWPASVLDSINYGRIHFEDLSFYVTALLKNKDRLIEKMDCEDSRNDSNSASAPALKKSTGSRMENVDSTKVQSKESCELLSEDDQLQLRKLMNYMIRRNIDNEFQAYSLSIVTYQALKERWLIPPSKHYESLIEELLRGDSYFAQYLYQSRFNYPFIQIRKDFVELSNRLEEGSTDKDILAIQFSRATRLMSELEVLYLKELEVYFKGLRNTYSALLNTYDPQEFWVEANKMLGQSTRYRIGSVDDPYAVFSARVGTLTVLRYHDFFNELVDRYYNKNFDIGKQLLGVLDLSAFQKTDLEVLGYTFADRSKLEKEPLDDLQKTLLGEFQQKTKLAQYYDTYNPNNFDLIWHEQAQHRDTATYFHLYEFFFLMKESVPKVYQSLQGTTNVFDKLVLRQGVENLSPQKREEIYEMSKQVFGMGEDYVNELDRNQEILSELSLMPVSELQAQDRVSTMAKNLLQLVSSVKSDLSLSYQFQKDDSKALAKLPIQKISSVDEDQAYNDNFTLVFKKDKRSFKKAHKKSKKLIAEACSASYLNCLRRLFHHETLAMKYHCSSVNPMFLKTNKMNTHLFGELEAVCYKNNVYWYVGNESIDALIPVSHPQMPNQVFLRGMNTPLIPLSKGGH